MPRIALPVCEEVLDLEFSISFVDYLISLHDVLVVLQGIRYKLSKDAIGQPEIPSESDRRALPLQPGDCSLHV